MTEQPGYTPDRVLRGLSLSRRASYFFAGLSGLAGASMLATLWATEPAPLPVRTQIGFGALIGVGIAWAVFATWALIRGPLFAADRIVAAAMAVVFSTLTTAGTTTVAVTRGSTGGVIAATTIGLILIVISATKLARARAYRAVLLARARELRQPSKEQP